MAKLEKREIWWNMAKLVKRGKTSMLQNHHESSKDLAFGFKAKHYLEKPDWLTNQGAQDPGTDQTLHFRDFADWRGLISRFRMLGQSRASCTVSNKHLLQFVALFYQIKTHIHLKRELLTVDCLYLPINAICAFDRPWSKFSSRVCPKSNNV